MSERFSWDGFFDNGFSRHTTDDFPEKVQSDGSTALYYELPEDATELQDLISAKNMNAQIGEIFRACYRYGQVAHSPEIRDIKKILFYAKAELERLNKLEKENV
jgi:hypothetical protein